MKKNLFIILGIFLIFVAILVGIYFNIIKFAVIAQKNNKEYEQYTKNSILGSDLMTLINKASNQNDKNNIEKDEKKYYIENDTTSIKIEVKFLESDKTFSMETISALGADKFIKNYSNMTFKCTKIEYHKKTNNIKYMLFEQI